MPEHVVKRGLDIPIAGPATGAPVALDPPSTIAYAPTEFRGITPRLAAKEGEAVEAGQVLFFHKSRPELVFRSPVAGKVAEVRRGARRVITDIVVEVGEGGTQSFETHTLDQLAGFTREQAIDKLLASGHWAALRTRPLDRVADPDDAPQAILIAATDSGPLMPGADELLADDDKDALQAAIHALSKLTDGKVYLTSKAGSSHAALQGLQGVETHSFKGPHPSGDPAVQVNLIEPPKAGGQVWVLHAWDAALMGRFLLEGRFVPERVYAAVGAGAKTPRLVKTLLGAPLAHIAGETTGGELRWIRGSVLTGEAVDGGRWASALARAVHLLPDTINRRLFGWALPQPGLWSFHRAFLSGFTGSGGKRYDMRPALHGGERAMVPVGFYGDVVATPDILPEFLFRSIIGGDLEESMSLGLLDISAEEAALCSYICPSKMEFGNILREGLDLYESET